MSTSDIETQLLDAIKELPQFSQLDNSAELNQLNSQLQQMAAITDLVSQIESADSAQQACQQLTETLPQYLNIDHIAIALCESGSRSCAVTAITDIHSINRNDPQIAATQSVLQESIAVNTLAVWPPVDNQRKGGLLSHKQYAEQQGLKKLFSCPLRDANGKLIGAWLFAQASETQPPIDVSRFVTAASVPVASSLSLVKRAQSSWFFQAFDSFKQKALQKRGLSITCIALFLFELLWIPVPYQSKCDCVIEPVKRQFVVAPFAGPLDEVLVVPGQLVEQGQLLAKLDAHDVQVQIDQMQAKILQAEKERDEHIAVENFGKAKVAQFEVQSLTLELELLVQKGNDLELRSPIAGYIVSGDLKDAEGMHLELGQNLFEVAPLDQMAIEVAVPEEDFSYVRAGMPVHVRLDAFPLRSIKATIDNIHPRSEIVDDKNVFVAKVLLEDTELGLSPGLHGKAWVKADRYPLGWNLVRRPYTSLLNWLGW